MNLYKISHVNKVYKNQSQTLQALKDIQLEIPEGKIVVILGPSGSGKSTMLNILSGIDIPTSGEVLFLNKLIICQIWNLLIIVDNILALFFKVII